MIDFDELCNCVCATTIKTLEWVSNLRSFFPLLCSWSPLPRAASGNHWSPFCRCGLVSSRVREEGILFLPSHLNWCSHLPSSSSPLVTATSLSTDAFC